MFSSLELLANVPPTIGQMILAMLVQNILFLILVLVVAKARNTDLLTYTNLRLSPRCNRWWKALLFGVLTYLLYVAVRVLLVVFAPHPSSPGPASEFIATLTGWQLLLIALDTALIVPFLEEMLNRAVVIKELKALLTWQKLIPWLGNAKVATSIGVLASAAVFGAFHGSAAHFVGYSVAGLVFAVVYCYTGSLWPTVIAHMLNNSVACIFIALLK